MFGISYDVWYDVCTMFAHQRIGVLESYLQWYPFSKISADEWLEISSEEFYEKYIKTGKCLLYPHTMICTDNYIQKGDGSFRNSRLVSPVLFLLLQAIGKTISDDYITRRPSDIEVFYAGNYASMRCNYKKDYDDFFKVVNIEADRFPYFLKSDIKEFFNNINIDLLMHQIDSVCNEIFPTIQQNQLFLYKELLEYCGNGKYPIVENCMALSYLATVVYLDVIDKKLHEFLSIKVPEVCGFKMVRYVDDLYIFLDFADQYVDHNKLYHKVLNAYSSFMREWGLSLNTAKCALKETAEVSEELKKSLYDEYVNGQRCQIPELCPDGMRTFLDELETSMLWNSISSKEYSDIVNRSFGVKSVEFTPNEVFNHFVYDGVKILSSESVRSQIEEIVKQDVSFLSLDPKRLTLLIMRCGSNKAIKCFLNHLFTNYREGTWNSYHTTIAINYLIQSKFRHRDLLSVFKVECPKLHQYAEHFCRGSFIDIFDEQCIEHKKAVIIGGDSKAVFLYLMYKMEMRKESYMSAYAYYKNYFDRISADIAFYTKYENNGKKPNYNMFYRENAFVKLYSSIDDISTIVARAHKLRNTNPLSHSSADLLDNNNSSRNILDTIQELENVLTEFITKSL